MKYLFFLLMFFTLSATLAQGDNSPSFEVYADLDQSNKDSICLTIHNCINEDMWFFTAGLSSMHLLDQNGEIVSPIRKIEATGKSKSFIKTKAGEIVNFCINISEFKQQFDFDRNNKYYIQIYYENSIKKKRTKIKTFKGKLNIESFNFDRFL